MGNLTIARKGLLLLSIPLAAQVVLGALLMVFGRDVANAHAWESHSQQVLTRAYAVRSLLLDAQSSLRGYVLTADTEFRRLCYRSAVAVRPDMESLSRLVADNPVQTSRVHRMAAAADHFLRFQIESAQLVDRGRSAEALGRIASGEGNQLIGEFRDRLQDFVAEEQRLASERLEQAHDSSRLLTIAVAGGVALNIALVAVIGGLLGANIKRRLGVLVENARRLPADQPLLPPLSRGDEIAEVDSVFREMAGSLATTKEALQSSNRELESFSYSVSHDLRTPLRAIDGFSRILEEEYAPQLDGEGKRLLGVIRRNTRTMAQLIDDLLAFSRLSRQRVSDAPVDMRSLAEQTFAEARRFVGNRDIEFTLGELPSARGDSAMLRQVLTNLISNAVKFTSPREHAHIAMEAQPHNGENVYMIRDNGVGFDTRYADKLFGVFQRLHQANEFEGTGVGLAIVQRVVQRHGGRVWAESTLNEGSTFYFTLPSEKREKHES